VGSDHRHVIPSAAVGGAAFMVICNLGARSLFEPHVIPVGVAAGIVGAPVFLWLISRGNAFKSA
jgi:iron complex transport system permease protein